MNTNTEPNLIEHMLSILGARENGDLNKHFAHSGVTSKEGYLETAEQLKAFIDEIPGGFLIYRAGGDEEIIFANRALLRIFACDNFAQFMKHTGGSFRGIVHPDDFDAVEASIYEQIKNSCDNLDYVEYRITDADGNTRWVEDYGHYVRSEAAGDIFYVFISDATEKMLRKLKKEVSQEIEQKKLLEQALKNANLAFVAKNAFLSNMSHDLRTPLNAIFGFATLAEKNINNPQVAAGYLDKIREAGNNILELIERVLELSYMETQDFRITEAPCDLREIAYGVYTSLLTQAKTKQIKFIRSLSEVKHLTVFADTDKLRGILKHIAHNAIKYTPKGGNVTIKISEEQKAQSEFSTYRFEVSDDGIGISENALERIFEPFERENNTTHCGEYGSGLGLTIAKHLTEMLGGNITVKSEPSKGSVFTVTIAMRVQEQERDTAIESEDPESVAAIEGKKILLVEDNEINLEIETEILEDLGFKVDTAVNGKFAVDAVKKAQPNEYSFILMDIQMPIMDGHEATAEIRGLPDPARASVPIIALSANALESDKRISMETGMNAHLNKPLDVPLLLKTVNKILAAS